jgi:ATP-dependent protease ClpP protease subunit
LIDVSDEFVISADEQQESIEESIELSRSISEAEKAAFDAKLSELQVARQELELLEAQINMDYQLSGMFTFHRRVEQKSMNRLYRSMRLWNKHRASGPWTIYLNSVGGDAWAGIGIIDELIAQSVRGGGNHEVTIKVRGVAASAAGMILQAADHRIIGRNSQLMIHKGSSGIHGTADDIGDEHEWWEASVEQMISLFLSRTDRISRREFLRKINRRDWWLSAEEAVEIGFADAIG